MRLFGLNLCLLFISSVSSLSTSSILSSLSSLASISWGDQPSSRTLPEVGGDLPEEPRFSSRAGRRNDKYMTTWGRKKSEEVSKLKNSPITYIKLPPSMFVLQSRNSNKDILTSSFSNKGEKVRGGTRNRLSVNRPDVQYVSNGKPFSVYKWIQRMKTTTTEATTTSTTTTTTAAPSTGLLATTDSPIIWLGKFFMNGLPDKLYEFKSPFSPLYWSNSLEDTKAPSSPILRLFKRR